MWCNAIQTLTDIYGEITSTIDERAQFAVTIGKLRRHERGKRENNQGCKAFIDVEPSLQSALSRKDHWNLSERKAKSHWFASPVKISREQKLAMIERAGACELVKLEGTSFRQTPDHLMQLAHSEDACVRAQVAKDESAPGSALWLLADDNSSLVKAALLENSQIPIAILERLSSDKHFPIARKAQSKLIKRYRSEVGIAAGNLSSEWEISSETESKHYAAM